MYEPIKNYVRCHGGLRLAVQGRLRDRLVEYGVGALARWRPRFEGSSESQDESVYSKRIRLGHCDLVDFRNGQCNCEADDQLVAGSTVESGVDERLVSACQKDFVAIGPKLEPKTVLILTNEGMGSAAAWRRIRLAVIARDKSQCQICGRIVSGKESRTLTT